MSSSAQRVPPHSIEAEQSVLGSMLLDANAVTQAMETLTTEDFYTPGHQKIYAAMASLHLDGQPVDLVTVLEKMTFCGLFPSVPLCHRLPESHRLPVPVLPVPSRLPSIL